MRLLLDLLPLILAAALVPLYPILLLLVLLGEGGLRTAIAFVAGLLAVRLAQGWLERNNRPILIGVSLVFGLWFLAKGVTGLMG